MEYVCLINGSDRGMATSLPVSISLIAILRDIKAIPIFASTAVLMDLLLESSNRTVMDKLFF